MSNHHSVSYGCSSLTHHLTKKQALRSLETAYDSGVRHFDIARLYGFGLAESILGSFLKGKTDIQITTKAGLESNSKLLKNLVLQNTVRYLYNKTKLLKGNSKNSTVEYKFSGNYSVTYIESSLNKSLKELNTDFIDYFLLHEALISDANQDELINMLDLKKRSGVIGSYGIAGYSKNILNDIKNIRNEYTVLQTENCFPYTNPIEMSSLHNISKRFYFSAFSNLSKIELLLSDQINRKELLRIIDLETDSIGIDLCLLNHKYTYPNGNLLFTSSNNNRIKQTIHRWELILSDSTIDEITFLNAKKWFLSKFSDI